MKTLYFQCKLLTDVILSQHSASEGSQQTLDFIPGSNFLGIVAREVYPDNSSASEKLKLFHTGDVRFGDAHVGKDGIRSLHVPACVFYPKLESIEKAPYIYYAIPSETLKSEDMRKMQLKQARSGYYIYRKENEAEKVNCETSFAIKSAYDKEKRRSKDSQMYGYQCLRKGSEFLFSVDVKDDNLSSIVEKHLTGKKHLGRSKTAQYGLVEIEKIDTPFKEPQSTMELVEIKSSNYAIVYAESRLIFLDAYGLTTARPTAEQLGIQGGEIDWGKSQIRTFQYAPYNAKRHSFDADRYGTEKGSVFVVKTDTFTLPDDQTVGVYKNEGFGKVIYNPDFLKASKEGNSICKYTAEEKKNEPAYENKGTEDTVLLKWLENKKTVEESSLKVYKDVEEFVNNYSYLFKGETFASQWGTIRGFALMAENADILYKYLFEEGTGYLKHGVAADKWSQKDRLENFEQIFKDPKYGKNIKELVVNLATQMGKIQ